MGHRQPAPAFFSMAELPVLPAPVVPSWLLKNQQLALFPPTLNCNRLPWLRQRCFPLIVFVVFRFLARVFRSLSVYCTFGLFRLLVFFAGTQLSFPVFAFSLLKPNFVFLIIFIVFYAFVLLCILPVLHKFFLHRPAYLLCLVRIFLSRVFVALRFVCKVQGFFSVFCTFCRCVCKFPVFFKFGDTAL